MAPKAILCNVAFSFNVLSPKVNNQLQPKHAQNGWSPAGNGNEFGLSPTNLLLCWYEDQPALTSWSSMSYSQSPFCL